MIEAIKYILIAVIFTCIILAGMFLLNIATHNGTINSFLEWGAGLILVIFLAVYTAKHLSKYLTRKIYIYFRQKIS